MENKPNIATTKSCVAEDYLTLPYARMVTPDSDGTFFGQILEFPGCISSGDTAAEALESLENAAAGWLEAALANGQNIPKPIEESDFSGKLMLRLPKSLHKESALAAERDGVSLNQFLVTAVGLRVGGIETAMKLGSPIINLHAIQQFNFVQYGLPEKQIKQLSTTTLGVDLKPPIFVGA